MLSLYKLYKADKVVARKAVTHGPRGNPYQGSSGTICYRNYNADWIVHRLAPTIAARDKPGGRKRAVIGELAAQYNGSETGSGLLRRRPARTLQVTSPRWGEGNVPGRHPRKPVPLQKKGTTEVSKGTQVGVGAATVAGVGAAANHKLNTHFHTGINASHPKYKNKIKKGSYTQYVY